MHIFAKSTKVKRYKDIMFKPTFYCLSVTVIRYKYEDIIF